MKGGWILLFLILLIYHCEIKNFNIIFNYFDSIYLIYKIALYHILISIIYKIF